MTELEKKLMEIDFKYDHLGGGSNPSGFAIHNSDCTKEYRLEEMFEEMKALVLAERTRTIDEVLELLVDEEYPITDPDSIDYGKMLASPKNDWNEELRAKLEATKEVK